MTPEKHLHPSSAELRKKLENLPEGDQKVLNEYGNANAPHRFFRIDGKKAKMGLIYQYLTACRVSEVFGKYAPQARHCIEVRIEGERAVLFVVKSAKKKTKRGWLLRPALLPNNPKYEPLVEMVRKYIEECKQKQGEDCYPFLLHENVELSGRYAERYLISQFKEYSWYFSSYRRTAYADPSLGFTIDPYTRSRKQLSEEEVQSYGEKIKYSREKGWIPVSVWIDRRMKGFGTNAIRKVRLTELERVYKFEPTMINLYAGWNQPKSPSSQFYINMNQFELDINEDRGLPRVLAQYGKNYFKKLLVPIDFLLNPRAIEHDGIEFIG